MKCSIWFDGRPGQARAGQGRAGEYVRKEGRKELDFLRSSSWRKGREGK